VNVLDPEINVKIAIAVIVKITQDRRWKEGK
jgi:hypothetical protein